jgi:hypothetical protein
MSAIVAAAGEGSTAVAVARAVPTIAAALALMVDLVEVIEEVSSDTCLAAQQPTLLQLSSPCAAIRSQVRHTNGFWGFGECAKHLVSSSLNVLQLRCIAALASSISTVWFSSVLAPPVCSDSSVQRLYCLASLACSDSSVQRLATRASPAH